MTISDFRAAVSWAARRFDGKPSQAAVVGRTIDICLRSPAGYVAFCGKDGKEKVDNEK